MAKILLINPNKWGRGITPIWIASHTAILKKNLHDVFLFDATFYEDWSDFENEFNTKNNQYKNSGYESFISYKKNPVRQDLQSYINEINPEFIFFGAISSHIHGEGEYSAIQYGYELLESIETNAVVICSGLQPTADVHKTAARYNKINYFITGESEFVLLDFISNYETNTIQFVRGLTFRSGQKLISNQKQQIISNLDDIGQYDYSLFEDINFLRPYNGEILKAVDYELSRGCPFTCSYCVETVIQKYYDFQEHTSKGGLKRANNYLRNKSAKQIFQELKILHDNYSIKLIRCQDTNFLTIKKSVLEELASLLENSNLNIMLYIETRAEGINVGTINLLKRLKVDGIGMGIELSEENFREENLNRFSNQDAILNAFKLLKNANIKRTAYNVIGFPEQTESSILDTIEFNKLLSPDNITVAFFTPYLGTGQNSKAINLNIFSDFEINLDSQLRSATKSEALDVETLSFYKENFSKLVGISS
jgi:magnesium-protoporphyrin IX monomethyl ester (oxidative) cyclase